MRVDVKSSIHVDIQSPWLEADDKAMDLGNTASVGSTEAELPNSNFECLFPPFLSLAKCWTEAAQLDSIFSLSQVVKFSTSTLR